MSLLSLAVSIFIITAALGNLFWATYSTYCTFANTISHLFVKLIDYIDGRRPIYIVATALLSIGSLGMATAHSIPSLFAWRVVQALGASAEVIGPGVIGDIYGTGRRGFVVGFYMGVRARLAPTIAFTRKIF
jgi:MFS family permease